MAKLSYEECQEKEQKFKAEHCDAMPWADDIQSVHYLDQTDKRSAKFYIIVKSGRILPGEAYRHFLALSEEQEDHSVSIESDQIGRLAVPYSLCEEQNFVRETQVAAGLQGVFRQSRWSNCLTVKANSCGPGTKILHVTYKGDTFDPDVADYLRSLMPYQECRFSLFIE